jgi:uncharacterized protein YlxW (UPF0749 family)
MCGGGVVRVRGWGLLVPVAFALAGVLFATSAEVSHGTDLRSAGDTSLPDLIRAEQHQVAESTAQVNALRRSVAALSSPVAAGTKKVEQLQDAAAGLGLAAGTESVRGPGLTVSLDDAHLSAVPAGFTGDDLVVHQQDVQAVVNALWAGGAEAMMLQGQRVISTSAVRCVGNTLILQGRVYSPPYRVTAVGDQDKLRHALDASPPIQNYLQYVQAYGLGWKVAADDRTTLPGYTGSVDLHYATPVDQP